MLNNYIHPNTITTMASHAVSTAQRVLQYYASVSYYASVPTMSIQYFGCFWKIKFDSDAVHLSIYGHNPGHDQMNN